MTKKTKRILVIAGSTVVIAGVGAIVTLTALSKKGGTRKWSILKNLNEIDDSSEKVPKRYFTTNAK